MLLALLTLISALPVTGTIADTQAPDLIAIAASENFIMSGSPMQAVSIFAAAANEVFSNPIILTVSSSPAYTLSASDAAPNNITVASSLTYTLTITEELL